MISISLLRRIAGLGLALCIVLTGTLLYEKALTEQARVEVRHAKHR